MDFAAVRRDHFCLWRSAVFADGARAFVGGSAIIGQPDVRVVIREFRNVMMNARRKLLLQKAHELGGTELVNKWIGLHKIGKKNEQLEKLAKEENLI